MTRWAHPRSRGENKGQVEYRSAVTGSSPLTRGKQHRVVAHEEVPGLIPAHAGKTLRTTHCLHLPGAHPRSRGENPARCRAASARQGSSPLTRGKRPVSGSGSASRGLIPAHAGKTRRLPASQGRRQAHPRSRGENLGGGDVAALAGWLIPAHAGKTESARIKGKKLGAHPRSRGENKTATPPPTYRAGSSPLTRGKQWPGLQ